MSSSMEQGSQLSLNSLLTILAGHFTTSDNLHWMTSKVRVRRSQSGSFRRLSRKAEAEHLQKPTSWAQTYLSWGWHHFCTNIQACLMPTMNLHLNFSYLLSILIYCEFRPRLCLKKIMKMCEIDFCKNQQIQDLNLMLPKILNSWGPKPHWGCSNAVHAPSWMGQRWSV